MNYNRNHVNIFTSARGTNAGGGNVLYGKEGDDTLEGSAGRDNLIGGAGNDTYILNDTFLLEVSKLEVEQNIQHFRQL